MPREIDTVVVQCGRQPVAGTVNCKHAMALSEHGDERHPLVRSVTAAVHEENRVAVTEFEYLRFPTRPRDSTNLGLGSKTREERVLRLQNLSIEFVAPHCASLRACAGRLHIPHTRARQRYL